MSDPPYRRKFLSRIDNRTDALATINFAGNFLILLALADVALGFFLDYQLFFDGAVIFFLALLVKWKHPRVAAFSLVFLTGIAVAILVINGLETTSTRVVLGIILGFILLITIRAAESICYLHSTRGYEPEPEKTET